MGTPDGLSPGGGVGTPDGLAAGGGGVGTGGGVAAGAACALRLLHGRRLVVQRSDDEAALDAHPLGGHDVRGEGGEGRLRFLKGTTEKWEGSWEPFFGDQRMRRPTSVMVLALTQALSSAYSQPDRVRPAPERNFETTPPPNLTEFPNGLYKTILMVGIKSVVGHLFAKCIF